MTWHSLLGFAAVTGLEGDSAAGGGAVARMAALCAVVVATGQQLLASAAAGGGCLCAGQVCELRLRRSTHSASEDKIFGNV